ncbi:hypothetical protein HPB51_018616 [Rhipicephalus microplus]|uniref:ZSWIM1/3 RNaseH-like domain-containing protein n=1 Tax=Rhipicephalus microplus TaxID=6941 RepID=A0A9J6F4U4_RHIMP|nr:hypothetical protein HPB51_018616 [Rhipicephalus microplus]
MANPRMICLQAQPHDRWCPRRKQPDYPRLQIRRSPVPLAADRTFKRGCSFNIYVAAENEGKFLEVRSLYLTHNHPVDQELFRHLPRQIKLAPELQSKACELMKMKANKMMVREQMKKESGRAVLFKDLSNIAAKDKLLQPRNDLPEVLCMLQEKHNATVHLLTDENGELQAVYFQDDVMKKSFLCWPEVIFIDATYKLLETRMSCFLVIIENGNEESEIVAVGLFSIEDADKLHWFFEEFKDLNVSWNSVRITMVDKDVKERSVIRELFPSSALRICAFHALQAFHREVSEQKLGITKSEQETALDIMQHMIYAKNDDYDELFALLQQTAAKGVVEYFTTN